MVAAALAAPSRWPATRQGGFTYIFLLFLVALSGILLAAAGQTWWMESKREKELDLLFAGSEMRRAIESYYRASPSPQHAGDAPGTPVAAGQYPHRLDELLEDHRQTPPLRHLRRIYVDPMTAETGWGLVRRGEEILGVHSLSLAKPLRTSGFAAGDEGFRDAQTYEDWKFIADPDRKSSSPSAPASPNPAAAEGDGAAAAPPGSVLRPGANSPLTPMERSVLPRTLRNSP